MRNANRPPWYTEDVETTPAAVECQVILGD